MSIGFRATTPRTNIQVDIYIQASSVSPLVLVEGQKEGYAKKYHSNWKASIHTTKEQA